MVERVQTGGVMQFVYPKQRQVELDLERKNAIETGYSQAGERKMKEKRNKLIFWIIVILIILFLLAYIILKK